MSNGCSPTEGRHCSIIGTLNLCSGSDGNSGTQRTSTAWSSGQDRPSIESPMSCSSRHTSPFPANHLQHGQACGMSIHTTASVEDIQSGDRHKLQVPDGATQMPST